MNNQNFENFADLQKSSSETFAKIANSALDSVEKLIQLNLAKGRAVVARASESAKETLQSKNPTEIAQKTSEKFQSQLSEVAGYSNELYENFAKLQKEMTAAFEGQLKLVTEAITANVDQKKYPSSDTFSKSIKSMIEAGNKTMENVNAAAKQFSEIAESNFRAVARIGGEATEKKATPATSSKKTAASTAA